jgi:hypothetical protein
LSRRDPSTRLVTPSKLLLQRAASPRELLKQERRPLTPIDRYVAELRHRLPGDPFLRRRVLAETEAHLRESAAEVGEDEAIARFGAPAVVASDFAEPAASRASVAAATTLLAAVAAFVVAYGLGENTLPPAPWPSADATPGYLRWKAEAATIAFVTGVAATGLALALALLRRARAALAATAVAAVVLTAAAVLAATHQLQRTAAYEELGVAGAEPLWLVALGAAVPVAFSLVAVAWAARVVATAQRASRSYGLSR